MFRIIWRQYLLPQDEITDREFRAEVARLAQIGLRVGGAVAITYSVVGLALRFLMHKESISMQNCWPDLTMLFLGGAHVGLSYWGRVRRFARMVGWIGGYLIVLVIIGASLEQMIQVPRLVYIDHATPGAITLVMMVVIGSLPLKPSQTLGLAVSISASYLVVAVATESLRSPPLMDARHSAAILLIGITSTGLTALIYRQRSSSFHARQQLLRAQARLVLTESAASQGRLAAALSHELNSPIGVIASGLDTLSLVIKKYRQGTQPAEQVIKALEQVQPSTSESCGRLSDLVNRMQRFTNLDGAAERAADLNELLRDTVHLLRSELERKARIQLTLQRVPLVKCQPQQLSAVFANLLLNSARAVEQDGTIWVRSSRIGEEIVIEVEDNGNGIAAEQLPTLFEPSFRVVNGRVSTSNWGLFNCRSIVTGHGGQIELDSEQGKGTKVRITVPVNFV